MKTGILEFSGRKLADARELAKLTQTDLAELVNKKKQHVSNYENGVAKPPADDLLTFMHKLNLQPLDLAE